MGKPWLRLTCLPTCGIHVTLCCFNNGVVLEYTSGVSDGVLVASYTLLDGTACIVLT